VEWKIDKLNNKNDIQLNGKGKIDNSNMTKMSVWNTGCHHRKLNSKLTKMGVWNIDCHNRKLNSNTW
jgi:hypothetical protein